MLVKSSPNDNFKDWTIFKAFADNNLTFDNITVSVF